MCRLARPYFRYGHPSVYLFVFVAFIKNNRSEFKKTVGYKSIVLRTKKQKVMAVQRIVLNEVSYFGPGSRSVIAEEVSRRGYKKALVVTDKDLMKFGVAQKVIDVLVAASIPYEIYDAIKPNPTVENVKAGVAAFKQSGADFMVAIGGGSSMDTSKAIGIIFNNPEFSDVVSLEGVADTKKRSVPIIAVPTTAGTAAEVTINYVITDEVNKKKMVCVDTNDIPVLSVVDAEMMASMPKGLTAATGMDALTHAIEGYITKGAWTMSDMFELKAISIISQNLKKVVDNLNDMEARDAMSVAQYIAGMGFSNVGLGLVHGMAHPLGAFYDTPHGLANAMLLPYVMEFNMPSSVAKYKDIAEAMGVDVTGMSADEAARAAVKAVKDLAVSVDIPEKLSLVGVKEDDLRDLAVAAFLDVCTPGNPVNVTVEDILKLYQKAF